MTVSHDGKWLYGVAADDDSVVRFSRNVNTGAITFEDCLSGDTDAAPACDTTGTATSNGTDSGFDTLRSFALAPGERQAYVASRADASVVRLARNPSSGELTFKSCTSGDLNTGPSGTGACATIAGATANSFGNGSGLGSPESVVVPRDGAALYVSLANDAGVGVFKRSKTSGKLAFKGCITGESSLPHCSSIAHATASGAGSGLNFPQFMALSPDRRSLYAAVGGDAAVATFRLP
jgi:6-phosphogluconolactonase (cycloisomerase 2 family)